MSLDVPHVDCSSDPVHDDNGLLRKPLHIYVNEERETVQIQENDDLLTIASMLREMGYEIDLKYPHIRVNGAWIPETSILDTDTVYHFCK